MLQEWESLEHSFYIALSESKTVDNICDRLEPSHPRPSINPIHILRIPENHTPSHGMPSHNKSYPIVSRPAYASHVIGPQNITVEVALFNCPTTLGPTHAHLPTYILTRQPLFALCFTILVNVVQTPQSQEAGTRRYAGLGRIEGQFMIWGSLGFTLNNTKEVLKLWNISQPNVFSCILLLVDPPVLHATVLLEINAESSFAANYLEM